LEECIESVRKQYYSGEGAIQWAGEAVARANCDLLLTQELRNDLLKSYEPGDSKTVVAGTLSRHYTDELEHRLARVGLNRVVSNCSR
jgi:hypothetical protein